MSFSSDVKQELTQVPVLSDCCAQARAYGMLLFGRMFSVSEISFATENENIARFYCDVIKELFGITPSLSSGVSKYTVSVSDEADRKRILEFFGQRKRHFPAHKPGEPPGGLLLRFVPARRFYRLRNGELA